MTTITPTIREIAWPEKVFLTRRQVVAFDKLPEFFGESYGAIYNGLEAAGIHVSAPPCAIYYSIDEAMKTTDVAAAVPIPAKAHLPNFANVVIPAGKVITTHFVGSYFDMEPIYHAMDEYLADHKLTRSLIVEEYLTDPEVEKDPAKWETNIYFLVK